VGNFARSMCSTHYLIFRRDCLANGSWGSDNPLPNPIVIEHWQWFGDEDALAAMCEENERLRALKSAQLDVKQETQNVE
jgi:hypothetical protein